ncbi:phosphatidate cytidylyltransferase [Sedimentibacter sp. zth1]|uniref:phosphatidate cytidylyltransferase n=1 Tax=Sedimentibacter sp. zth1 TaxID=2816908 RepID=UPI001A92046C|nr:phosphatidate cytidylyltransferase [Sedimentibacter sp. zth1]QSX06553.1 phosphatidate cytidylyltransferase [Sedimentibacter sp. zth1]
MKKRIITGIVGGLIIALVTYIGGLLFDAVYLLIAAIGVHELSKLFRNNEKFPYEASINYLLILTLYLVGYFVEFSSFNFIILIYVLANFIFYVTNKDITLTRLANTLFVGLYVVMFMYYMIKLNNTPYVWLVYLISFGTDTFAYFTGVFIGKHKLCPNISPKKTIEGAIGGIIGSTILCIIFFEILGIKNLLPIIIFNVFASILSMFGDLLASKIKREHSVKDFGNFLPGHGGILDRFDSVLFVAPVVYYFVTYFI